MDNTTPQDVADKLRQRRLLDGLSQTDLGEDLGVSFQQVQKYERGLNRISAGALFKLCELRGWDPAYFMLRGSETIVPVRQPRVALEINRVMAELDERQQNAVLGLMRALVLPRRKLHLNHGKKA